MRRFSQRSALVTLSEINITPLLDLAFVLLIIFVITTPLLEQSLRLSLPKGGEATPRLARSDIRTVEISPDGKYRFELRPCLLAQIGERLALDHRANTNLVVNIRADKNGKVDNLVAVMEICRSNRIPFDIKMEPPRRP
jgi:biopolymer transport protein ExbD